MRHSLKVTVLATLALAIGSAPALAGGSVDTRTPIVVAMADCATADTTMMAMAKSMPGIAATGNLDRDFMAMATSQSKVMMAAAKLEMACGKNSHAREMAASIAKQNHDVLHTLMIGGGATH